MRSSLRNKKNAISCFCDVINAFFFAVELAFIVYNFRCEQHEIKQDNLGSNVFDRSHFYTLEVSCFVDVEHTRNLFGLRRHRCWLSDLFVVGFSASTLSCRTLMESLGHLSASLPTLLQRQMKGFLLLKQTVTTMKRCRCMPNR